MPQQLPAGLSLGEDQPSQRLRQPDDVPPGLTLGEDQPIPEPQYIPPRPTPSIPPPETVSQRVAQLAGRAAHLFSPRNLAGTAGGAIGLAATSPAELAPGPGTALNMAGAGMGFAAGTQLYDIIGNAIGYHNIPMGVNPETLSRVGEDVLTGSIMGSPIPGFTGKLLAEGARGATEGVLAGLPEGVAGGMAAKHFGAGGELSTFVGAVIGNLMKSKELQPIREVLGNLLERGETSNALKLIQNQLVRSKFFSGPSSAPVVPAAPPLPTPPGFQGVIPADAQLRPATSRMELLDRIRAALSR